MRNRNDQAVGQGAARAEEVDGGRPRPEVRETHFSAILTPNRSLDPTGFLLLMAVVISLSFAAGLAFVLMGAWPVAGFLGVDAVLVYWAFRLNYRDGRLYETVDLTGDVLRVTRVSATGRARSWTFNPYWARCEIARRSGGIRHLCLSSHGKRLIFGSFLSPEEKEEFAAALTGALRDARGGERV
jgi:uncharacterized membrane protein